MSQPDLTKNFKQTTMSCFTLLRIIRNQPFSCVALKTFHNVTPVYSQTLQPSCQCQLNFPTALRQGLRPQTESVQKKTHGIVIPTPKKSMMLHFLELFTGDRRPFKCARSYSPAWRGHWFWIICVSTNLRRTPHFSIVRHKKALTKACSQLKHHSKRYGRIGGGGEEKRRETKRKEESRCFDVVEYSTQEFDPDSS